MDPGNQRQGPQGPVQCLSSGNPETRKVFKVPDCGPCGSKARLPPSSSLKCCLDMVTQLGRMVPLDGRNFLLRFIHFDMSSTVSWTC